ncbi:MAG: DUF421 domain-containing protein [Flavobacteriaceae bacterium]
MEETVRAFDLGRMLFGDEPPLFMLEIVVRCVVIYTYAFFLVRWVGGRSVAQLSMVEFLLVIALGSAIGDPLFYADVPLVHCLLVITVIVALNKALDMLIYRSQRAERFIDGRAVEIVRDGVIGWRELERRKIGHQELFQQLRTRGVRQLGEIEHAYLEPNGQISVFTRGRALRGLPIVPAWEVEPPETVDDPAAASGTVACVRCGTTLSGASRGKAEACPACGGRRWAKI